MRRFLCIVIGAALAGACSSGSRQAQPAYESPPVVQPQQAYVERAPISEGSLFNPVASSWSPWRDPTARNAGDIVTVRVSVENEAENSATTDLGRESKVENSVTALLGFENRFPGVQDTTNNTTPDQLVKSSTVSNFQGDGETKRTGKITAEISAVVTHVFPNGNMRIHGSQSLLINAENSLLTVEGIIRPVDVSVNNIVESDRIASARIEITGKGVVTDKQRPGLVQRLLDWFWLM